MPEERKKYLERAGIEPRSSCSASDHSYHEIIALWANKFCSMNCQIIPSMTAGYLCLISMNVGQVRNSGKSLITEKLRRQICLWVLNVNSWRLEKNWQERLFSIWSRRKGGCFVYLRSFAEIVKIRTWDSEKYFLARTPTILFLMLVL